MEIRVMTPGDYEEAYTLWNTTDGMGLRALDDSKQGIEQFLKRNPDTNFICRIRGKLVGVILSGHDGRRAYIYHAAVHSEYRHRGIGRGLVEAVIQALKKEGIRKIGLVVFSDNTTGNRFWDSMGFTLRTDLNYRNRSLDLHNY